MSDFFYEQLSSQKNRRRCAGLSRNFCQKTLNGPILGLLALVFLAPITAAASNSFVGKIISINSASAGQTPTIVRTGKRGLIPGKQGDTVFAGDTIKTGKCVTTQIVLADKSVIDIGAEATLRIKAFIQEPAKGRRNYALKALKGTVRFIVPKENRAEGEALRRDSRVVIETPAAVARTEGAEFAVTNNPDGSVEVAVFEGNVTVRNSSLSVEGAVTPARNQFTRVQCGMLPDAPRALSGQRGDLLAGLATVDQACRPEQSGAPVGKYTKEDAARDLADGMSVADVLDRAAGSGLTVDQMVSAAVSAGVEPGAVVYAAVQGGYSTEAVVASAITNGASLDAAVSMAISAGGDISAVVSGATQAGASPADVATVAANTACSSMPVYGYSLPMEDAATVPAAPVSITDGGGGLPSTQPASPSMP